MAVSVFRTHATGQRILECFLSMMSENSYGCSFVGVVHFTGKFECCQESDVRNMAF